ncbi:hypothetical protein EV360DRAFT_81944 [Lentinula raphanica]|nr:hypothetical protein EV360DRAFT_81944 [Lentinula raphanica]
MSVPAMQTSGLERSYVQAELNHLNKADLIKLVERQMTKWPSQQLFHRAWVQVEDLKKALLDPSNGFTTNAPFGKIAISVSSGTQPLQTSLSSSFTPNLLSTTPVINPPVPAVLDSDSPIISLKLLINNMRFHQEGLRRSQTISISYLYRSGQGSSDYVVKFTDIFNSLQQTHTALEGIGELTACDPDDPEYGQILMKGDFSITSPSESLVVIPASRILKLNVMPYLFVPPASNNLMQSISLQPLNTSSSSSSQVRFLPGFNQHLTQLLNDPDSKPLQIAEAIHPSKKGSKVMMVNELTKEASILPGYVTFKANRHCVLSYDEIASHWRFIATFLETHSHCKCPITNNIKSKKAIALALGMQTTSLSAAEQGHRLVECYGPGGSHELPEVVAELKSGKTGAFALMDFLREWEVAHPIQLA